VRRPSASEATDLPEIHVSRRGSERGGSSPGGFRGRSAPAIHPSRSLFLAGAAAAPRGGRGRPRMAALSAAAAHRPSVTRTYKWRVKPCIPRGSLRQSSVARFAEAPRRSQCASRVRCRCLSFGVPAQTDLPCIVGVVPRPALVRCSRRCCEHQGDLARCPAPSVERGACGPIGPARQLPPLLQLAACS